MGSKLFVGGLAYATTDAGLKNAFSKYGTVRDAKVITDRDSGQSRGFGFVTFEAAADADAAMDAMNNTSLDGRTIRVNAAEEKPRTGGFGGGGGYRGGGGGGGGYSSDRNDRGSYSSDRGDRGGYGDRGGRGGRGDRW
jgi:RNA recognition motif-containing protein